MNNNGHFMNTFQSLNYLIPNLNGFPGHQQECQTPQNTVPIPTQSMPEISSEYFLVMHQFSTFLPTQVHFQTQIGTQLPNNCNLIEAMKADGYWETGMNVFNLFRRNAAQYEDSIGSCRFRVLKINYLDPLENPYNNIEAWTTVYSKAQYQAAAHTFFKYWQMLSNHRRLELYQSLKLEVLLFTCHVIHSFGELGEVKFYMNIRLDQFDWEGITRSDNSLEITLKKCLMNTSIVANTIIESIVRGANSQRNKQHFALLSSSCHVLHSVRTRSFENSHLLWPRKLLIRSYPSKEVIDSINGIAANAIFLLPLFFFKNKSS